MFYALNQRFRKIPGSSSPLELRDMIRDPFEFVQSRFDKYGEVFRSSVAYPCVWMIGADANRFIMVTDREKFSYEGGYGKLAFARLFEHNILVMDGDEHAKARAILEPAVSRLGLEDSLGLVQRIWEEHVKSVPSNTSLDVYQVAQAATYEVSARALAGLVDSEEVEELRPYFEAVIDGAMAHTQLRIPGGMLDKALDAREVLIERLMPYVKKALASGDTPGVIGLLANHRDEKGNQLPAEDILHHALLLYWAGYDTTASAGSWVLHLLAHHPDWQDRMRREIFDVLGDEPYQLAGSAKLKTVSWFLREVERFGPSLFMFPRGAIEDFEFKGHFVPKGTPVFWSPWMSHRDPGAFPHPHSFDPGRWDPERGDDRAQGKHMVGFGGGPRLCVGRSFAQMQLRVMLTTLLRNYHLEPDPTKSFTIQGLPVHHPDNSHILFRELLPYQQNKPRTEAAE